MEQPGSQERDWKTIAIMVACFLVVYLFWYSPIVYPIKLFVVFLHELSHGLMSIITGGKIISIQLDYRLGGLCVSAGGIRFLVASAGYLGSLVLGGLILVVSARARSGHLVSLFLGLIVAVVTLLYIPIGSGWLFSIPFAAVLVGLPFLAPQAVTRLLMMFIGMTSCLYAIIDIKEDLFTLSFRGSDADTLAQLTMIPALVWGILWSLLSLIGLVFFLTVAVPRKKVEQEKPA